MCNWPRAKFIACWNAKKCSRWGLDWPINCSGGEMSLNFPAVLSLSYICKSKFAWEWFTILHNIKHTRHKHTNITFILYVKTKTVFSSCFYIKINHNWEKSKLLNSSKSWTSQCCKPLSTSRTVFPNHCKPGSSWICKLLPLIMEKSPATLWRNLISASRILPIIIPHSFWLQVKIGV